ncbi:MAG: protein-L-isoaspartate(D-aspartate) O-methyltransferase [Spirochaetes bacterium]|nr:protein-L-isoaspartate(D-aspartate) O-methyltransferase [Spirochaetota bacterium]
MVKQTLYYLTLFVMVISNCAAQTDERQSERDQMVKRQIKGRGIKDPQVLNAMKKIPRHYFVPEEYQKKAYYDHPLPIGFGQTISQPYIVALMTELLNLSHDDKVLEIGTGSGYQAAILTEVAAEVYTIEIISQLYQKTTHLFQKLKLPVQTKSGDGYYGWPQHAPYDAIIVTCAAEFVPPALITQLKPGGKICIPVGPPFKVQNLLLITKIDEERIETEVITQVVFVPLTRKP